MQQIKKLELFEDYLILNLKNKIKAKKKNMNKNDLKSVVKEALEEYYSSRQDHYKIPFFAVCLIFVLMFVFLTITSVAS